MNFSVFWIQRSESGLEPKFQLFTGTDVCPVLKFAEGKRKTENCFHVVISSSHEDCVSGTGVDAVENGKTPDGETYEWSKQHRGGPPSK